MIHQETIAIVTDGSGDATVYLPTMYGRVHAIKYAPGDIDTGGDLTITGELSLVPILTKANAGTATVWYYPKVIPNKNTDGSAFTDVAADIQVMQERIKVVVAQGGATKTGAITVYVDTPY